MKKVFLPPGPRDPGPPVQPWMPRLPSLPNLSSAADEQHKAGGGTGGATPFRASVSSSMPRMACVI